MSILEYLRRKGTATDKPSVSVLSQEESSVARVDATFAYTGAPLIEHALTHRRCLSIPLDLLFWPKPLRWVPGQYERRHEEISPPLSALNNVVLRCFPAEQPELGV